MNQRPLWASAALYAAAAMIVFVSVGPFLSMVATSFKGPAGTPASSNRTSQWATGAEANAPSMAIFSSAWLTTRSPRCAKRGSAGRLGS